MPEEIQVCLFALNCLPSTKADSIQGWDKGADGHWKPDNTQRRRVGESVVLAEDSPNLGAARALLEIAACERTVGAHNWSERKCSFENAANMIAACGVRLDSGWEAGWLPGVGDSVSARYVLLFAL